MSELRARLIDRFSVRPVPFEHGGESVHLLPWTAAARQHVLTDYREAGHTRFYERLFAASVCDDAGRLAFDAHSPDDLSAVGALDGQFIEAVARRVSELNGLSGGDDPKAPTPSPGNPS